MTDNDILRHVPHRPLRFVVGTAVALLVVTLSPLIALIARVVDKESYWSVFGICWTISFSSCNRWFAVRSQKSIRKFADTMPAPTFSEADCITGFYEEEVPYYRQGTPKHELESLVTALEVQGLANRVCELDKELNAALEALVEANGGFVGSPQSQQRIDSVLRRYGTKRMRKTVAERLAVEPLTSDGH